MTVLSVDSSLIDFPMLLFCNSKNMWVCYQDLGFRSSQLTGALLAVILYPDSSQFQVLQPHLYSGQAALNVR